MPGMGGGLQANNPTMEAAFRSALHHQAIAVILVALLLAAAYAVTRTIAAHRLVSAGDVGGGRPAAGTGAAAGADDPVEVAEPPEPAARRILRITFGCLWIFDGLLPAPGANADRACHSSRLPDGGRAAALAGDHHPMGGARLAEPPRRGSGCHRLDPGRHRRLDARGAQGSLVAPGRTRERLLGDRRLGHGRGLGPDPDAVRDVAVRGPRRRRLLRGRRRAR